ncbi:MAG: hypothetical protein ACR2LT_00700 [Pyrinomonadaceae bacterium]
MVYKVDGGSSAIPRKDLIVKKPADKPAEINKIPNPKKEAGVYANRDQNNQQANILKYKLEAQFILPADVPIPKITPAGAQSKADEIIAKNGGKDNLNTDNVGRDLANIAHQNPADAWAVTQAMLGDGIDQDGKGKIKENDKDEIAQSFTESLKDSEITTLAQDENGRNLLDRMEHHLLSGSVHGDERDTADRIQNELGKYRTFSDWQQGIDPHSEAAYSVSYGTAFDTNASPEEAAAGLKTTNRLTYDISSDTQAFTDQLEAHKDDAEWIQKYFSALGSDKTAELTGNAATPSGYSNYLAGSMTGSQAAAEQYTKNMATIRDAFNTLQQGGNFSQTDMNTLVNSMQKRGLNPSVAVDVFGNASSDVQESFVRATMANGNDTLEAAGSYVLSQMSSYKQSQILGGLSQDQLNTFIKGAMAGQTEALDVKNYLETGRGDKTINLSGVEKILQNANGESIPYPPYSHKPFSPELQTKIFNAAANALTDDKAFENFSENTDFKNALSTLTISQHKEFINSALDADGKKTGEDFAPEFRDKYSKLLQMTLFTPPLGEKSADLMKFVDKTYKDLANDLKNLPDANSDFAKQHPNAMTFEDKYGRNRAAMARAFGEMTGVFFKSLDEGLKNVKDDAAKAAEVMDPIFKLIDFGTGAALDKAGPIGKVISTAIDLTGASGAAKNAIKEKIKDGKIEDALQDMKDNGVDVSKLGEQLYEAVHNDFLPNSTDPSGTYKTDEGTSVSIKDAWQNGYDHVEGAPK